MSKLILSIDGGGIRGAAATEFLAKIEQELSSKHNTSIRNCVDFYAGTSTGSIIALALATTNLTMDKINELYNYQNAQKIFTENEGLFEIDGVNAPKFEASGKTEVLKNNLGNAKIGDVPQGKHVLAITYAVEKRKPVIVKSTKQDYLGVLSYKVADASSAAPTYFPTKEVEFPPDDDEFWLIDGGVIANNPTMCVIAEARRTWNDIPLDQIRVLSIGTGYNTRKINGPASQKWGALQWVTKGGITNVLSDERIVAYQAMTITKTGSYIRVNAELRSQTGLPKAPDDAMDDVSRTNIKRNKELGDFWFQQYGSAVIDLLLNKYTGPSLDHIDPETGKPIIYDGV